MLDKFLVLLERFVVAHELIAANSKYTSPAKLTAEGFDSEDVPAKPARKPRAKKEVPVEEPEAEEEEEPAKPARKPRAKKEVPVEEPEDDLSGEEGDLEDLRDELDGLEDKLSSGDSDDALDEFDDLMDSVKAKTLDDIKDKDLPGVVKKTRAIVKKHYGK